MDQSVDKEIHEPSRVSHPIHYAGDGKVECMDALRSMMAPIKDNLSGTVAYWWGCAFKYLWRWYLKNGLEDLLKARQCLDYLIEDYTSKADHESRG
ncbi:DUF3310 domain-containing protein [Atopobium fossor]|uniref:DUF3310 domain-containing protein n=1 Tax=Atopobium fossor TaxID=39487 RepID=UPI000550874E|nr:DUF3310 domain-containing protein [Atopobium fossor]